MATFDQDKVEQLMLNSAIIRNRGKINAAINNAKLFIEVQHEFGSFSKYMWGGLSVIKLLLMKIKH